MNSAKILVIDENVNCCETMDSFFLVANLPDRTKQVDYSLSGMQALTDILAAYTCPHDPHYYRLIILDS